MWVLDHLDDLESDFSVFHRISPDDLYEMPGPRFFAMAHRLSAYGGVMTARIQVQQEEMKNTVSSDSAVLAHQFGDDIEIARA